MARAEFGYDPIRMTTLDTNTGSAVTALRAISSSDPSAQRAIAAVNRLLSTLEVGWLPAIRAVRSSTALSGGVTVSALGGDDGDSADRSRLPQFHVFDPLSALFPGDEDITAEEIAAKIDEILGQRPSGRQFIDLGILGRALTEIAENPELSAEFLEEIGADGVQEIYTQLFQLGLAYPYALPNPDQPEDRTRLIGTNLALTIGDPFNLVVAAGSTRPSGRRVVSEAIAELADADHAWEAAGLAGLARVEGLPPRLARELLDAVSSLEHDAFPRGFQDLKNSMYPELEWDYQDLQLFVIANNPILVHDLIHDHDGFVDGGEELLRDLLESKGYYWRTEADIASALGKIFGHIIEFTPADELVHQLSGGRPGTTGVIFDLVDLLLEQDLKVAGHHVLAAIGPLLPEIMGAVPGSARRYSPNELRSIFEDLFEDLSPAQVEQVLGIIVASAVEQAPISITSADFNGRFPAGNPVGDYLDAIFGPVTGALDDVIDDRNKQAEFWRSVLSDAFGLIPLPGSAVARFAIKRGVNEIINGVGSSQNENVRTRSAVEEAERVLIENTVVVLYNDPAINARVVENALADWPDTAIAMVGDENDVRDAGGGGQRASLEEVERIHHALLDAQENGTLLPADVFVKLPQIEDMVDQLEDELILSPERVRGN